MWKLFGRTRKRSSNSSSRRRSSTTPTAGSGRICLKHLSMVPRGNGRRAADRLTSLDSVERNRVLKATAAAERRAREVREAMARKKAQESASRFGE